MNEGNEMVWRPIAEAPKDGTPILLVSGSFVYQGWWIGGLYPWYIVDDICHEERVEGGCWIELNQGKETGFTHWAYWPSPPPQQEGNDDG